MAADSGAALRGVEREGMKREELALAGAEETATELLKPSQQTFTTFGIVSIVLAEFMPRKPAG